MALRPTKLKSVPWLVLLEAARAGHAHWTVLTPAERTRLRELLLTSKGRPKTLPKRQQAELKRLVRKLDVPGLGKDLLPIGAKARRRRRRR